MIDVHSETLGSLTEAAGWFPRRRRGKKPHVATLHRWVTAGVKGVRLEVVQVGGTRCTSREAVQRFCNTLTSISVGEALPNVAPPSRLSAHQRAVDRDLDREGIR